MKLSDETLWGLAKVMVNVMSRNGAWVPQDTMRELMEFFFNLEEGKYMDAPSSDSLVDCAFGMLGKYNNTIKIKKIIEKILLPEKFNSGGNKYVKNKVEAAGKLQSYLQMDGYKLITSIKGKNSAAGPSFYFFVLDEKEFVEHTPEIEKNEEIKNIVETAKERFAKDDYKGAIASSFLLVETVIKNMLDELNVDYNAHAQFRDLYPRLSTALGLNPAEENIESRLEPILEGLKSQVSGLYYLANDASDRHKPKLIPKRQDAKLAMNTAFALCEYLRDTQKNR